MTSADGWWWATAEGSVELTGPGTSPDSAEVEALVDHDRQAAGEHPDWAEHREAVVADRRVLVTLRGEEVYGASVR